MAELLYRLGKFSARRAWLVITSWAAILVLAVGAFLVGFSGLSSSFDIPGTASGAVTDELADKLPDYSGASGTVVFTTEDGSALTNEQKAEISALVAGATDLPDVAQVVDPFATEAQRADQAAQIEAGRAQVSAARTQLDAGQAQVDAAQAQLTAAQAQLDATRAQAEAAGASTLELDAAQAQLTAQQAQLDAQKATLAESLATLNAQSDKLERGAELLTLAKGIQVVSTDGATAVVNIAYTVPRLELPESAKAATIDYFESTPIDGVNVSFSSDIAQSVPQLVGIGEVVGVVLAGVILVIVLGSLLAAAFPIVTALVGVGIGATATLAFSGVIDMTRVTPILGVMLGLAVGIDYSLFIINRHRKQLLKGAEVRESIGLANGTAGNAVLFAGTTVIIALLALNVTGVPFLGLMGTAGALSVLIAVLIAITLTPALLGLAGMRVLGRKARTRIGTPSVSKQRDVKPMGTLRAVVTAVVTVGVLLVLALPSLSMRLGLPDGSSEPAGSTSYEAFTVLGESFGEGANGPLLVTATLPAGLDANGVLAAQVAVAQAIADQGDVVAVAPIAVSSDNRLAAFQVLPEHGPNSVSTEQLVRDLRGLTVNDGDRGDGDRKSVV